MTKRQGICEGGPYDGRPLYHGTPVFQVAMRENRVVTYAQNPTAIAANDTVSFGEYHHDGKSRWIWKGPKT